MGILSALPAQNIQAENGVVKTQYLQNHKSKVFVYILMTVRKTQIASHCVCRAVVEIFSFL